MIPRSVKVNGVEYTVRRVPAERLDSGDAQGLCDANATLILIAKELSTAAQMSTYLHELGHASFYESGAAEAIKAFTTRTDEVEELLCQIWLPVYRGALK